MTDFNNAAFNSADESLAGKCIQIVGYKNTGKTTLITKLIRLFHDMSCSVAVIKHDVHGFDSDVEGTDTYMARQAGAIGTAITSPWRTAVIEERETPLIELVKQFSYADVIMIEGFKQSHYAKLVLIQSIEDIELLEQLNQVIGIVIRNDDRSSLSSDERAKLEEYASVRGLIYFEADQPEQIVRCLMGILQI